MYWASILSVRKVGRRPTVAVRAADAIVGNVTSSTEMATPNRDVSEALLTRRGEGNRVVSVSNTLTSQRSVDRRKGRNKTALSSMFDPVDVSRVIGT